LKLYEIFNIDKPLYEYLKEKEPLKVNYHSDADGVSSCALIASIFNIERSKYFPISPSHFGMYKEGDLALDLGSPLVKSWNGCIIDHHEHPDNPSYPLVLGQVPTGLTIYHALKDHIPDDRKWLVVVSCVGDGQPEAIPSELWDMYPELWHMSGNVYKNRYGGLKAYPYPLYAKSSSPVNSLCRTGAVSKALDVLLRARNIRDVINNVSAQLAQKEVSVEENRVLTDQNNPVQVESIGNFTIVTYKSKFNIAGRIGANLSKGDRNNTYIIINEITKEASVRGVMTIYLTNKLNEVGYLAGGHSGYGGITLLQTQTTTELINDLRRILTK